MPPVTEASRVLADTLVVTPSLLTKRTFFFGKLLKIWPKKKAKESEAAEPFKDLIKERKKSAPIGRVTKHKPAPCKVPFFKVDPPCVNSCDISNVLVVKSSRDEYEQLIHSFLNTHYWPREPCVLGLWVPLCSSYLQSQTKRFVTSGDRWLAFDNSGGKRSLIGVLVAQKTYPWQADELEWIAESKCFRPEQKHLYFRAHTLRSSNLFQKYRVPYIYNIEVLATGGSKCLSERVAELLLRTSITHALEMRHPLTMIIARNCKEACICEKMGMYWEWSMNDDEYVDPFGKRMFFPRLPNQAVSIYIRKIDIEGPILDDLYSSVFIRNIYEDPEDIVEEQEELTISDNPLTCDSTITEATTNVNYDRNRSLNMQISDMSGMPYYTMPTNNIQQPFNITSDNTNTCIHKSFDSGLVSGNDFETLTANLKSTQYNDSTTCDTKTPVINYSKSCHTESSLVNDSTSLDTKTSLNDSTPENTNTQTTYGYTYDYYKAPGYSTSVVKRTPVINYSTSLDTKTPLNDSTAGITKTPEITNKTYCHCNVPVIDTFLNTKTTLNDSKAGDTNTHKINCQQYYYIEPPVTGYSTSLDNKTHIRNNNQTYNYNKTPHNSTFVVNKTPLTNHSTSMYNKIPIIKDSTSLNTKTSGNNNSTFVVNKTPLTNHSTSMYNKMPIIKDSTSLNTKTSGNNNPTFMVNKTPLTNHSTSMYNKIPIIKDSTSLNTKTSGNNNSTFMVNKTPLTNHSTSMYNKIPIIKDSTSLNTKTSGNNNAPEINNKTDNDNEAPPTYYSISLYREKKKQTND